MKCEVVREGQACSNTAELIVRTPWTTQLTCVDCATLFKRYETQKLEFFCDWPLGGRECGGVAAYYIQASDDGLHVYHRPLCEYHGKQCTPMAKALGDGHFDPKLVPYKPPAQPTPRVEQKADGTVALRCHCGKEGKYRGGVEPMPLCDEHAPSTRKTEPPSTLPASPDVFTAADRWTPTEQPTDVLSALEDLAVAVLQALTKKVEALTEKIKK